MTGINTTRGVPFSPSAAGDQRKEAQMIAKELDRQKQEADKQAARDRHREEMRAHGRMLDEQARQARRERKREQRRQVEQCYREREKS